MLSPQSGPRSTADRCGRARPKAPAPLLRSGPPTPQAACSQLPVLVSPRAARGRPPCLRQVTPALGWTPPCGRSLRGTHTCPGGRGTGDGGAWSGLVWACEGSCSRAPLCPHPALWERPRVPGAGARPQALRTTARSAPGFAAGVCSSSRLLVRRRTEAAHRRCASSGDTSGRSRPPSDRGRLGEEEAQARWAQEMPWAHSLSLLDGLA